MTHSVAWDHGTRADVVRALREYDSQGLLVRLGTKSLRHLLTRRDATKTP